MFFKGNKLISETAISLSLEKGKANVDSGQQTPCYSIQVAGPYRESGLMVGATTAASTVKGRTPEQTKFWSVNYDLAQQTAPKKTT